MAPRSRQEGRQQAPPLPGEARRPDATDDPPLRHGEAGQGSPRTAHEDEASQVEVVCMPSSHEPKVTSFMTSSLAAFMTPHGTLRTKLACAELDTAKMPTTDCSRAAAGATRVHIRHPI